MILDLQNLFSALQAITATANSSNVIDTMPSGTNAVTGIGSGEDISLFATMITGAAGPVGATLTVTVVTADDAALTVNATTLDTTGALSLSAMSANTRIIGKRLPHGQYRRYLGLVYTVSGGPLTAGNVTAGLVKEIDSGVNIGNYAVGSTIS